ncbi:methyltransferase [Streptomyces sp. NBC_01465]|uniref:methyltransferase n=1 Tax=Streptomyces sp. NBC_01465 TaxID=2903878 RepID=UPI002E2FECEC|nr:methyltransferase [Streptomyces sp. NBC_01465]
MNRLTTSWGDFALTRFPEDPRNQLRAWDAADEYLLNHLAELGLDPDAGSVVVVGDRWGALVTALGERRPVQITDSFLGQQATRANLARAGVEDGAVRLLTTRDAVPERIDVLVVRVPKSLALLEDQLHRLAPALHADTVVVGGGMVKEIHTSTLKLFEQIVGPTRTSLAVKKARLIFATPDPGIARSGSPWPRQYVLDGDSGDGAGLTAVNHAGIFCAERLDIGTRFLLKHLPRRSGSERVLDLGCGNGIVGTAAAALNPDAEVVFVDESFPAVVSAEETFRANLGAERKAEFLVGDGTVSIPGGSIDLVLNNPPFHTHQSITDQTARRMFSGSKAVLRNGGELLVVGNRHLGYHQMLRRVFGNCQVVAGDPKFVVLRAVKRG